MLYVHKHTEDTGGLLYPPAINQTFWRLYVMELCLIGLFFLGRNAPGNKTGAPQLVIMIVVLVRSALFQILLNKSFDLLQEHLPITLEDDCVLRDEAYARAQARRYAQNDESAEEDAQHLHLDSPPSATTKIMRRMRLKCAASTAPHKPRNPATS